MRILMSGSHLPDRLPAIYAREFEALGCKIALHYNAWEEPSTSLPLVNKVVERLAPGIAWRSSNQRLLALAERFKPDLIFLFKGMDIFPETLRRLRATGALLVNYNADHPFFFFARGTGNANVTASVPLYDLHITYSRKIASVLAERFPSVARAIIPFGHDVDDATFERIKDGPEIRKICFLGNADAERARMIGAIHKAGVAIDVFGHNWDRHSEALGGAPYAEAIVGFDALRVFRSYRVHLNLLRPHNEASHNMRSFEIPGCGGVMLAPDTPEHSDYFEPNAEAFFFRTQDEMIELARRILDMEPAEVATIRDRARARSAGYHYKERAAALLHTLEEAASASTPRG
jgi:spore maturation protein CgeB